MTLAVPGDGGLLEPTFATSPATTRVPGLTIAAMTSIGAGIIHAAAAGVHAEHPQLARLFIICAIAQIGAGLLAMARPNRLVAGLVVAVNAVAVGGWLATRITGISWIDGLEVREAAQFADTACALLAATAVGCALAAAMIGRRQSPSPHLLFPALAIAALTVPAMLSSGTHVHSHTTRGSGGRRRGRRIAAAHPCGRRVCSGRRRRIAAALPHHRQHATGNTADGSTTATWPRPWDPTKPIDVSGVPGVTPEEEARATAADRGLAEGSAEVRRHRSGDRRRLRIDR